MCCQLCHIVLAGYKRRHWREGRSRASLCAYFAPLPAPMEFRARAPRARKQPGPVVTRMRCRNCVQHKAAESRKTIERSSYLTLPPPRCRGFFFPLRKDLTWASHGDAEALIYGAHSHTETHLHAFEADSIIFSFLYQSFKENINHPGCGRTRTPNTPTRTPQSSASRPRCPFPATSINWSSRICILALRWTRAALFQ